MLAPQSIPHHLQNFGFWLVDNEVVFSKVKSILQAQERNTHDVRYYYYDHIFSLYDWRIEPTQTLTELYVERARQLRQNYDYLILLYSGGSDSSNALKTFLYNNVKLDEVAYWYTSNNEDTNRTNLEIIHAANNMLHRVRDEYNITVRKLDDKPYFEKTKLTNIEWTHSAEPALVAAQLNKEAMLFDNSDWLRIANSGKRVAVITGLEKPRIFYDNGWKAAFLDVSHAYNWESNHIKSRDITLESFYLTPDMPQITIKQSHVLANYIDSAYNSDTILNNFSYTSGKFAQDLYFKLCRTVLYPYWNDNTYSIGKDAPPLTEKYKWVWNSNTQLSETYLQGLAYLNEKIDPYFLNGGSVYKGLVGNWSKSYNLR